MYYSRVISKCALTKRALAILSVPIVTVLVCRISALVLAEGKPHPEVLISGGGTSHDFAQDYQTIDAQALRSVGDSVRYIDSWTELAKGLNGTRVLIQASNQIPPPEPAIRNAIVNFVDAGGGLLVVHAGLWYNWSAWPEYNRILIGGGSRSHDKLGEFEVVVTHPEHPIMKGVPANFSIHDELYHQEIDPTGSPVEVLAIATSPLTGKTFPSVWVVNGLHGRIACIALGHDEESHNNPAYVRLLTNAVSWVAKKQRD
jgi:uncharacterized protein